MSNSPLSWHHKLHIIKRAAIDRQHTWDSHPTHREEITVAQSKSSFICDVSLTSPGTMQQEQNSPKLALTPCQYLNSKKKEQKIKRIREELGEREERKKTKKRGEKDFMLIAYIHAALTPIKSQNKGVVTN